MTKKHKESSLVQALNFVALAQKPTGAPYQTHVCLRNNMAVAFDGVLAAGHKIEEDIDACPQTLQLVAALKKCGQTLAVTQLDNGKLSVRSGKFRAYIPCSVDAVMTNVVPDPAIGVLTNEVKKALLAVSPLIVENSQHVLTASANLKSMTVMSTNRHVFIEYWHGVDLPPGLILPKLFINALEKIDKNLVSFGYTPDTSFTVYFEDGSWLRTQLYNEKWPSCEHIMDRPHPCLMSLPAGFYEALDAIIPFAADSHVRLRDGALHTHEGEREGAIYEVEGLRANVTLNSKYLKLIEGAVKTIDFVGHDGISIFYGDNVRGAIAHIR